MRRAHRVEAHTRHRDSPKRWHIDTSPWGCWRRRRRMRAGSVTGPRAARGTAPTRGTRSSPRIAAHTQKRPTRRARRPCSRRSTSRCRRVSLQPWSAVPRPINTNKTGGVKGPRVVPQMKRRARVTGRVRTAHRCAPQPRCTHHRRDAPVARALREALRVQRVGELRLRAGRPAVVGPTLELEVVEVDVALSPLRFVVIAARGDSSPRSVASTSNSNALLCKRADVR